jgi:hypothetical protein
VVIGAGEDITFAPVDGDIITCAIVSNYRCRTATTVNSTPITVDIDSAYVPNVMIEATPGLTVKPGTIITFHANVTEAGPAPTYQWSLNGAAVPGATSSSFTREFASADIVTCTVTGSAPCGLPSFNTVFVVVDPNAPSAVSAVGRSSQGLTIVPNPNAGEFAIKGQVDGEVSITVVSALGQIVYRTTVLQASGKGFVSLPSELPAGTYLLVLNIGSDRQTIPIVLNR